MSCGLLFEYSSCCYRSLHGSKTIFDQSCVLQIPPSQAEVRLRVQTVDDAPHTTVLGEDAHPVTH
jgi:hypothetical protein